MALLFADENVPSPLVKSLRALGHDVLTAHEAGKANQRIGDPALFAHAIALGRAMLTNNRRDYHRLHSEVPAHEGIISFTSDNDIDALAKRIHDALSAAPTVKGELFKIIRPG